ncbi:MAG TPA: YtxH domain-containing protein [Gemmatimonadaceae bacterium]|nr:YtxH domain-containing protein [Gemmatimonadaceae bacterium]
MKSKFREQFPRLKKRLADREVQTDMVAAALVGAAIGVAATLLLRPRRTPHLSDVARDTASRARKRGEAWLDSLPNGEEIKERLSEYVETARDAIDRTVEGELRALRKRLRRQRSRVGL